MTRNHSTSLQCFGGLERSARSEPSKKHKWYETRARQAEYPAKIILDGPQVKIHLVKAGNLVPSPQVFKPNLHPQKPLSSNYSPASMTSGSSTISRSLLRVLRHHPAHPKYYIGIKKPPTSLNFIAASNGDH